jgi:hypothetical protein
VDAKIRRREAEGETKERRRRRIVRRIRVGRVGIAIIRK